ncbi:transcriptional regulator, TetR family [Frankineae bacterium MT45]|nr:transcriptional regulator, TetR family [Frankineae bacterium MT45]
MGTAVGTANDVVEAATSSVRRPPGDRQAADSAKKHGGARTDGRRERWAEHRKARRSELIDAATDAVIEYGANVGMDQIAATAKTSKTVIYRYFSDKADLHQAVAEQAATHLIEGLVAALEGVTLPRDTLAAGVNAFLTEIDERPEVYRFVMMRVAQNSEALSPRDERRRVLDYPSIIGELVSMQIAFYMKISGLDPIRARPWGVAIVGFIRSAGDWWLEHRDSMSRDELSEYLSALLWSGMGGLYISAGMEVEISPPPGIFPILPKDARIEARAMAEKNTGTDIDAAIQSVRQAFSE